MKLPLPLHAQGPWLMRGGGLEQELDFLVLEVVLVEEENSVLECF